MFVRWIEMLTDYNISVSFILHKSTIILVQQVLTMDLINSIRLNQIVFQVAFRFKN